MKSIIASVVMLFLMINMGLVYYIVLFGDVPRLSQRLDLLDRRMEVLVHGEPANRMPEVTILDDESLVVLSAQQEEKIAQMASNLVAQKVDELVAKQVGEEVGSVLGTTSKEHIIPLGSAGIKTNDAVWREVGLQTDVDLSQYTGVKSLYFEGNLSVPTGNGEIQVRLVDGLTGVVGGSEIASGNPNGEFVRSGPLSLINGSRLIKVQMRTTMDFDGRADGLKLKIVIE